MNFAAVLSPTIKIFHQHLGPNLYIFAVKVSLWFHWHFTEILWHITAISPPKNTDQGDFMLKTSVRSTAYCTWRNKFFEELFCKKKICLKVVNLPIKFTKSLSQSFSKDHICMYRYIPIMHVQSCHMWQNAISF